MFAKTKLADMAGYTIMLLISQIILGVVVYFVMILSLGVFSKKELNYLKRVFVP